MVALSDAASLRRMRTTGRSCHHALPFPRALPVANAYEPTPRHDCNETSPLWLLNAPVITTDGLFRSRTLNVDEARALLRAQGFASAIGHAQTAAIVSELLGIDCPMNRYEFRQRPGQRALVFRLARRLEEGQVLHNRRDIERVGYSFMLIIREA